MNSKNQKINSSDSLNSSDKDQNYKVNKNLPIRKKDREITQLVGRNENFRLTNEKILQVKEKIRAENLLLRNELDKLNDLNKNLTNSNKVNHNYT